MVNLLCVLLSACAGGSGQPRAEHSKPGSQLYEAEVKSIFGVSGNMLSFLTIVRWAGPRAPIALRLGTGS